MVSTTFFFVTDTLRQTVSNLSRTGTLWRGSTWRGAASLLFGRRGIVRECFGPWRQYFRADYHPASQDDRLSRDWLRDHADAYVPVRGA
jgi:predicted metal-dependent hydrolase